MRDIQTFIRTIFLICIICLLCACADPSLTRQDNLFLGAFRKEPVEEKDKDSILYSLIRQDPVELAEDAAKKEDFRLIGLAMGYMAGEEDASVFGVTCTSPQETQNIVFGCVPPPPVIFKLIKKYNAALIQKENFPNKESCKIDNSIDKAIEKMEKDLDDALKRDSEKAIKKWEDKNPKLYNN